MNAGMSANAEHELAVSRPILAYWSRPLEAIITHVLAHEIGHHFGFSDDDMQGIEDRPD